MDQRLDFLPGALCFNGIASAGYFLSALVFFSERRSFALRGGGEGRSADTSPTAVVPRVLSPSPVLPDASLGRARCPSPSTRGHSPLPGPGLRCLVSWVRSWGEGLRTWDPKALAVVPPHAHPDRGGACPHPQLPAGASLPQAPVRRAPGLQPLTSPSVPPACCCEVPHSCSGPVPPLGCRCVCPVRALQTPASGPSWHASPAQRTCEPGVRRLRRTRPCAPGAACVLHSGAR